MGVKQFYFALFVGVLVAALGGALQVINQGGIAMLGLGSALTLTSIVFLVMDKIKGKNLSAMGLIDAKKDLAHAA